MQAANSGAWGQDPSARFTLDGQDPPCGTLPTHGKGICKMGRAQT